MKKTIIVMISCVLLTFSSCIENKGPKTQDNFDRSALLAYYADELIIPAYENYILTLAAFRSQLEIFEEDKNEINLQLVREHFLSAYKAWQKVSLYDLGKAEQNKIRLFTNIFPLSVELLEDNISTGNMNLALPSNYSAQGFPAIEYLLYGDNMNTEAILFSLQTDAQRWQALNQFAHRIEDLANEVLNHWKNEYRDQFVQNDGNSATASFDLMLNDFMYYYEKFLRAGKVGIPAGVFSGDPLPQKVESYFSSQNSKVLFIDAFQSVEDFFFGKSFITGNNGISVRDYLDYIAEQRSTNAISPIIEQRWNEVHTALDAVKNNFAQQILEDNISFLQLYDALQSAVVPLKVDMMQALNVQVDYVDADGD